MAVIAGATVDRVLFTGDSLTDSDAFFTAGGALAAALAGPPVSDPTLAATLAALTAPPPPLGAGFGYGAGSAGAPSFSDGAVWADALGGRLGVAGGEATNYAVGSAEVLREETIAEALGIGAPPLPEAGFRIDFAAQVERILADTAGEDLSGTAVSVFIGLNDFARFAPSTTNPLLALFEAAGYGAGTAEATLAEAAPLAAAGVGAFVLHTLPGAGGLPATSGLPEAEALGVDAVAGGYNAALKAGAAALGAVGAGMEIVETGAFLEEVGADATAFGFRSAEPFLVNEPSALDPVDFLSNFNPALLGAPRDQVAYWDPIHLSEALHGVLASFVAESLTSRVEVGFGFGEIRFGGFGDDLVLSRGGDDLLRLLPGDDVALAGRGDDDVGAGFGHDLVIAGAGDDVVDGGWGHDVIADGDGRDLVRGRIGDDLLIDGAGDDVLRGGWGDDVMIFTEASLFARAPDGDDVVHGGRGRDTLVLRVADAEADLGEAAVAGGVRFGALGLTALGVEEILVVEGTDLSGLSGLAVAGLETAEAWNLA